MSKQKPFWTTPSSSLLLVWLCAPIVLLTLECVRGAYCDYELIRTAALQREMSHLRSDTVCHAGNLVAAINLHGGLDDWQKLSQEPWLKAYWRKLNVSDHQVYAAVVDATGRIVLHTSSEKVGQVLGPIWYQHAIPEGGPDVVQVQNAALAGDTAAYDVRVPLIIGQRQIGELHQGLNAAWFDNEVASQQRDVLLRWAGLSGLVAIVDAAAIAALIVLARRFNILKRVLVRGPRDWADRLGQIASGLAHEIRNPLHALRINLHTLQRSFSGRATLEPDELTTTIAQSNRAIDTLDGLMRDLLQFTSASGGSKAEVNLVGEIRATLNLMSEDMRRKQVEVRTHFPQEAASVAIDPGRFRQILVDLLTFAQNNAGSGGSIDVDVLWNGKLARLDVTDTGPGLNEHQQTHVFEPFQAPRETASGLGLALVKHFSEDAGGTASCLATQTGCRFRVLLPLVPSAKA